MSTPGTETSNKNTHQKTTAFSCAVIATVYNEVGSIQRFIDSLLNQTTPPQEIIIVDGLSTDGTNEQLQTYADKAQITLISQHCNIAEGRNIAVKAAQSCVIASTDAGCVVAPNWLEEITRPFKTSNPPDVVAGNYNFDCQSPFEEAVVLATNNPERTRSEESNFYPSSRSVAFTKAIWEKVDGYPEWLYAAEDTLFNIRLRQLGATFTFAEDAIVTWRPRSNWRALARQFFNYARGNGRIGFSRKGYIINLKQHAMIAAPLLLAFIWPWLALLALYPLGSHIRHNLWPQSKKAGACHSSSGMSYRVLAIMEYVRIFGMLGYIRGRLDRLIDPQFCQRQIAWMGVDYLDDDL